MNKKKKKNIFSKLMLFLSFSILISVCSIRSTYAWLEINSQKGIYPYYEVEFITPSSDFYVEIEVATNEVIDDQMQYIDISDPSVNTQLMYPGDRITLRFNIINMGAKSTSISIYFKNIIDTQLKDPETNELIDNYLSENIILGSFSFKGNNSTTQDTSGFVMYANEQLDFTNTVPSTLCDNCLLHGSTILFAGNVEIPSATLKEGKTLVYYQNQLAIIESTSTNIEQDKEDLARECYEPTYLDWYMMFDRAATIESKNSTFQIGSVLFAVD